MQYYTNSTTWLKFLVYLIVDLKSQLRNCFALASYKDTLRARAQRRTKLLPLCSMKHQRAFRMNSVLFLGML